jgi:CRP-like cAMP-binding protein
VRGDGVLLPLRLSHSLLADLVCARRPSVTVALQRLAEGRLVERAETGWILHGDPVELSFAPVEARQADG